MRGEVADAAHRLADGAERRLVAVRPILAVAEMRAITSRGLTV